jgi:hypothetical protein
VGGGTLAEEEALAGEEEAEEAGADLCLDVAAGGVVAAAGASLDGVTRDGVVGAVAALAAGEATRGVA